MARPDFTFKIARKVGVDADFDRRRAVISCKTKDGKSIQLKADFQTLKKLHKKIQDRLETPWRQ